MIRRVKSLIKSKLATGGAENKKSGFDIIGDIHGYHKELVDLLSSMDYKKEDGVWKHPSRTAVFVGDLVSRGPDSRSVLKIVHDMVENGSAYAILGNHELNMIGYFTLDKKGKPCYQPPPSNILQLERIRAQYAKNVELLQSYVKWLRTLPFYLELDSFRVVHAYWNDSNLKLISETITEGRLSKKMIKEIFKGKTEFAQAVKQTTRGIELSLPDNLVIKDAKNVPRTNFRIKWWQEPSGKTFRELGFGNRFLLPDYTVPEQILFPFDIYDTSKAALFFGHYCLGTDPKIVAPNLCCVDGCVAGNGTLLAYRWNGENTLSDANIAIAPITL